jgi:hypothetical protein
MEDEHFMAANMMPPGILPAHVQQAAMTYQLGAPIKSYKTSVVRAIIFAIICLGIAVFFAVNFMNDRTVGTDSALFLLLLVLAFVAGGIWMIVNSIQIAGQQTHLFQNGIIVENRGQVQVFPWNQIAEVWQSITRNYRNGIYTGTTYLYRLRRVDGHQIKLSNNTKNIAELGPALVKGVTQELYPRAMRSILNGETIAFGSFSVHQQGLNNGKEWLPWPQVQGITIQKGFVRIQKVGKFGNWASKQVSIIPNIFVFTIVVEEMLRQNGRG